MKPLTSHFARIRFCLLAALALGSLGFSGCVSAKYKRAAHDTPPPVPLNLSAVDPAVEATVNSVIVFRGPGSWKHNAYWDEYVISLANRSAAPMTVTAATLIDFQNAANQPGTNPWELESASKTWEQKAASTGRTAIKLGAGAAITSGVTGTIAASTLAGGYLSASAAGAIFAVVAVPAFATGTIIRNVSNRHAIEDEFRRRQLGLPLVIAPRQFAQGSFFFRVSPGPQRLLLSIVVDGQLRQIEFPLGSLAALHLEPPPQKPLVGK